MKSSATKIHPLILLKSWQSVSWRCVTASPAQLTICNLRNLKIF